MEKESIIREIEKERKNIVKFAQELVKIKSVNSYTPEISYKKNEPIEKGVAQAIKEKLEEFGLKPKTVAALPERPNIICSLKRSGKPCLILNGHMDTVPLSGKEWRYEPFSAKEIRGRLYGRGAIDMKSSLAAMVYAIGILKRLDIKTKGNLITAFVVDEESGACSKIGTDYLLRKGLKADAAIVCEAGTQKICVGTKGGYRIRISVKGEAISTGSKLWEKGKKGNNAVLEMAKILIKLNELKLKYKSIGLFEGRKPIITPGTTIKGGSGINIVPDKCEATVDMRLMPNQNKEEIKSQIIDAINKVKNENTKVKIEDLIFVPSAHISKNEKIVKILQKNAEHILKRKPAIGVSGSWCDAHFFIERGIPAICGFGPDGKNFHGCNEFAYTKSIADAAKIYALTAYDFIK